MKLLSKEVPIRFFNIAIENLFDSKKDDDDVEENSNTENDLLKNDEKNNLKDTVNKTFKMDNSNEFDIETNTVSANASSYLLQNHLKLLRTRDSSQLGIYKIVGGIMIVLTLTLCIGNIFIFNNMIQYSNQFLLLSNAFLNENSYVINLAKYSNLRILEKKFEKENYYKYNIDTTNKINYYSMKIQKTQFDIFSMIDIVIPQLIESQAYYNKIFLKYNNILIPTSYYNGVSLMVFNGLFQARDNLVSNRENFYTIIKYYYTYLLQDLKLSFDTNLVNYQVIFNIVTFATILFNLVLQMAIFLFYKAKRKQHNKIMYAYEKLTDDEVCLLINKIELFEKEYIDYFKDCDEYKLKKIKFNENSATSSIKKVKKQTPEKIVNYSENEKLLSNEPPHTNQNNHVVFEKKHRNGIKINEEKQLPKEKVFVQKNNMASSNIVGVFFIIFSLVCYKLIIYFLFISLTNQSAITTKIVYNLQSNQFSLDYLSVKLDDLLYQKTFLLVNDHDESFHQLLNISMNNFINLTFNIYGNKNLFLKNITDIINGDVCLYIPTLNSCNPHYNLKYVHTNGLMSILNYYFESVLQALNYYRENEMVIYNMTDFFTNYRFTSVRFLIENIRVIYGEIYNQLYYVTTLEKESWLIDVIILAIVFNFLFFILIFCRLKSFISNIKNEEMLSNRLIGEVPLEIIEKNAKLEEALTFAMETKIK